MSLLVERPVKLGRYLYLFMVLSLIGYMSPWVVNPGVSLTLSAYDLAEWTSLHPAARASNPLLFTSFLLRLPLVCIALIAAFASEGSFTKRSWWLGVLFTLGIALALLPPLEFFSQSSGDANYNQQFILALAALLGGMIGLSGRLRKFGGTICASIGFICGVATILGHIQAYASMQQFGLPVQASMAAVAVWGLNTTIVIAQLRA